MGDVAGAGFVRDRKTSAAVISDLRGVSGARGKLDVSLAR